MKGILLVIVSITMLGCSNTWRGIKTDTYNAGVWTKQKINSGAAWVERHTR